MSEKKILVSTILLAYGLVALLVSYVTLLRQFIAAYHSLVEGDPTGTISVSFNLAGEFWLELILMVAAAPGIVYLVLVFYRYLSALRPKEAR